MSETTRLRSSCLSIGTFFMSSLTPVGGTTLMEFSNVECSREWKWKSVISKVSLVEIDLCGTVLLDAI